MTDKETYDALVALVTEKVPGFEVRYKNESWVSKLLGILSYLFNPLYMTEVTTTRYPNVYFPNRAFVTSNYKRAWKILAHEFVHLWDRKQEGVSFNVGYASPQMWAVLALSALSAIWVGPWGLLGLLPLLLLLPLPSPGRKNKEMRAYVMSMAVNHWRHSFVQQRTKDWVAAQFLGSAYYFMWPFRSSVYNMINAAVSDLDDNKVPDWKNAETFGWVRDLVIYKETE